MADAFQGEWLAEETHTGRVWLLPVLLVLIGPAISLSRPRWRVMPVTWSAVLVGVIALGIGSMVWSGFQYRFLRNAVEIRLLGFRLRSIPAQSIVSYSIEPWSFARGYGIRGTGSTRAYVWCNKVVHIKTSNGDVFLGHKDPERIVRDLDMVTAVSKRG